MMGCWVRFSLLKKSGTKRSINTLYTAYPHGNWVGAQLHHKWGAKKIIFLSFAMMAGANLLFLLLSSSHSVLFEQDRMRAA